MLIEPPSPERLGAPLLGLQSLAASLLAAGHEVAIVDAAARESHLSSGDIVRQAEAMRPDIIGVALFTRWVWHAYQLIPHLRGLAPLLVAGGPHATSRPLEPLTHGFDISIAGEAEQPMCAISAADGGYSAIPGIWFRSENGAPQAGPPAHALEDLDQLPHPLRAQHLFDSRWYQAGSSEVIPGGILTSRGCPARCTFCANYVTGRRFRFRSAAHVVDELNAYHDRFGVTFFPFWDDAFTADSNRLLELCAAFETDLRFPIRWSAITRANMVTPTLLAAMKRAGCVSVNFGVESGDDDILRIIKKGVATRHVVQALEWSKELGLTTACNFMLGFPQDTPRTLHNTVRFMESIAPMVDTFSTLGVAVPFPGTPLYEDFHFQYGFTDWWLRESYSHYAEFPPVDDFDRFYRHYIDDANLELDFFRYTPAVREAIREALRFKGEHNLRRMGLLVDPVYRPVTAA